MALEQVNVDYKANPMDFYAWGDDKPVFRSFQPECGASFSGRMVPKMFHGEECLFAVRDLSPEEVTV